MVDKDDDLFEEENDEELDGDDGTDVKHPVTPEKIDTNENTSGSKYEFRSKDDSDDAIGKDADIDKRIAELKKAGKSKKEIAQTLYKEGYSTRQIMKKGYALYYLSGMGKRKDNRSEEGDGDDRIQSMLEGAVRGEGYLSEWKEMIRHLTSRTRELNQFCYSLGLGALTAALSKSGLSIDNFKLLVSEDQKLKKVFESAAETVFKALEYYKSDLVSRVEEERDEARAYASFLEAQLDELKRNIDPRLRLEKMIYNMVIMSASTKIDPRVLSVLIEKWLELEVSSPSVGERESMVEVVP